ncbi:DNA-binding transcriptional regulator, LysR family [Pseudomonas sp. ok272]|uniref:LysR family transcriptional regulator n=1 Tax=unclassified Pseudomonas TaxID=196821 RepID=UPI0008CC7540|nr:MULTISPECIES: LysR family transcriptional regulator [unclassified Pseudomonas]SEM45055.1 DNA-binding transcriptional regulator, LysR family [Pseudomonas sp. ok272]SFM16833.1 DNA-binding transcriptional regulator, LysR family [Pseudomonas sp. ok602]
MLGQLHDLDLHLLRLFVSVVEFGGFSAAQGELGLSQSSISQHMAKLETRLGYRLCSRGKGGFKLTPKGEQLLLATRALFQSIEAFRHQSNGVAGRLIGDIRVGLSEALDCGVVQQVAEAIRRFRERDESVRIELISAMPGEMERLLLQQRLDLAIGYFSQVQSAFDYRPLFSEPQHLYCGAGHPLFVDPRPDLETLRNADVVDHPYRFFRNDEPLHGKQSSARSEQVEGTLAFILSGKHLGYLPEHFARPWEDNGLLRGIGQPQLSFEVAFHLARHRAQVPGDAQVAFEEDLLAAFGM